MLSSSAATHSLAGLLAACTGRRCTCAHPTGAWCPEVRISSRASFRGRQPTSRFGAADGHVNRTTSAQRCGVGRRAGSSPSSSTCRWHTTGRQWPARHGKRAARGKPSRTPPRPAAALLARSLPHISPSHLACCMATLGLHPSALPPATGATSTARATTARRRSSWRERRAAARCNGRPLRRPRAWRAGVRCAAPARVLRRLDMARHAVHAWACKGAVGAARACSLESC